MSGVAAPGVDYVVAVVASGTVGGADAWCSPEEVTALLGAESAEHLQGRRMWREYGLVEFFWEREAGYGDWCGTHFTVQLHRLEVPLGIVELNTSLTELGIPLTEVAGDGQGVRRFARDESGVAVLVDEASGMVLSVSAPSWFSARGTTGREWHRESLRDSVRHLRRLPPADRLRWVERQRPEAAGERTGWWLGLVQQCQAEITHRAETRTEWVRLALWLIRQGEASGFFGPAETAERIARLVSGLRTAGHTEGLAEVVPSADDIVRGCLAALPVARGEVATRDNTPLSVKNLAAMRLSRQAATLVAAALPHLGYVHDPGLRAELSAWAELRGQLI